MHKNGWQELINLPKKGGISGKRNGRETEGKREKKYDLDIS